MIRRLILYAVFILLPGLVTAQMYHFKHITTDDGLSTNYIQCMLRDRQGFMWFGTQNGLCKYNGYGITVYKTSVTDKRSVASSDIFCLYQHDDEKIYIGTRNSGLNIFNPIDKSFERIPVASLTDPKITCIEKGEGDNLLIGTGNGINLFNVKTREIKRLFFPGGEAVPVYCFYKLADKILIGTAEKGLWQMDKSYNLSKANLVQNDLFKVDETKLSGITQIASYAGKLYFATQGEGFLVVDPLTLEIEKVKRPASSDLPPNYLKNIVIKENKAYANTKTGFVIYNLLSDKVEIIEKGEDKKSLNDNDITCFLIDEKNDIWLGTFSGGVNVFFSQTQRFPNLAQAVSDQFRQTYAIYEGKDHQLWIGGERFLRTYNIKTGEIDDYSKIVGANYVLSIVEDDENNIWLGTWGQGLVKFNKATRKREEIRTDLFGHLNVLTQRFDEKGRLWIGTFNDGLFVYDPSTGSSLHFSTQEGLYANITYVFRDSDKNYWVGTAGSGVFFVPRGNLLAYKAIKNYEFSDTANSIASNTVYHIYEDADKNKWFATENGLSKSDAKTHAFTNYREEEGLADNYLYSVLPDSAGNLWMSSNKGISRFDPKAANVNGAAFRNYDQKDGLLNNEYAQGAYCRYSTGELIFGSTNGINIFNPRKIRDNFHVPLVYIVSYKRSGKDVSTDTAITYKKALTLSWRENYFQFEVAALDYNEPSKNRYMFKLEGYDTEWSEPTNVRYISYTELPGGEYTLKVKASNNDGVWNETPFQMHITVIPPFWKTAWFFVLVSLLGVLTVVLYTRYRTQTIKKENKILENKVSERTKELAEKNRDITSSIEYARRIQEAILPAKDFVFSKFENAFILYKPKDIVSGDFYWFGMKDGYRIFAVVDCTGHGVPGAFMSMIGHNLLNQIVQEKGITDPGEILNQLHHGIQNALKQGRNEINTNDGMDVSLLSLHEGDEEVRWAGAFRPMIIVRTDSTLEKYDGNKYPVGGAQLDTARTFTTQRIALKKGDTMYLFSDGYADQFGGDKGKKLMVKRFYDMLLSMQGAALTEQRDVLEKTFEQWRGNHEQVDDVLVVAIRF
ncbi:MAG: two-component regulator propeller domain-containing protein [Bacteroidia bacterium]